MAIDDYRNINQYLDLLKIKHFYNGDNNISSYLIKWDKEDLDKFTWRTKVSYYQNFIKPIVNGLTNRLFIKNHQYNILNTYAIDIDLAGSNIKAFTKKATMLAIRDGLVFIYAGTNNKYKNLSKLDEEQLNIRGYLKLYEYNQLVNYRYNDNKLVQIVFKEEDYINDDKDEYNTIKIEKYIRLFIGGGEIYIKNNNKIELVYSWNNNLKEIPITIFYGTLDFNKLNATSILQDLVNLNQSHYNLKSGIMNISHIASNPIPILYGSPQNMENDLKLGVNSIILFPTNQGGAYKFEWVEVNGSSVQITEREIKELESYIISTSYDILRVDKINTATEALIKDNNNKSILSNIADNLEYSFNKALEYLQLLTNTKIGEIIINKDIDSSVLNAEQVRNIIELKKNGIISIKTALDTLVNGEILQDIDIEKEVSLLEKDISLGL